MAFSRSSLEVIGGFTAQLGLPMQPAQDGSFGFVFANAGSLSLTSSRDGQRILVSLARRPQRVDAVLLQRGLDLAGFDPGANRLVHVGLASDESIHFAIELTEGEFDLPSLDAGLQYLSALHARIA